MEENHAATAFESNDHGWQKVTYVKRQSKKKAANGVSDSRVKVAPNGTVAGGESIFRSLELESEDRRRRIVEARRAADAAEFDDGFVRSKLRARDEYDDGDYDDDEDVAENGKVEEVKKVKVKKPKKPKVTVAEAASKIDASDLETFLVDISVGGI